MIIKNLLSMSSVNVVKSAVQFLITLLITYFVTPTEFGLVAFSLPFIAFISMLTDLGLSSAMIQRTSLTKEEAGAATTLMVAIGIGCALVLAASSKPLGAAVNMQGLPAVLAALSGSVVLSISAMGPRAVLERSLQYQTIALIEAGAALTSATIGVVGALLGWGIWALIAYYVLMQAVRAVAFYVNTRRHIHLCFKWRGVAQMLSFGGWVLASNVLNFSARNVGNLMIGAKLGAAAVGLFGLAFQFMTLPLMILSWPGGGVLMATLSRMNGEGEGDRRKAAICAVLGMTAMITFPAMIYLTFGLKYPVATFLSPHWQEVLPLIAILAPAGAAQSIAAYAGPILLAHDKARLQFWVSTANSASMVLAFLVALPFGLTAVAAVYLIVSILVCALMLMIGARNCAISYSALFGALMPATVATSLGALCALVATRGDVASLSHWLIATAVYTLIVLGSYVVFRRRIWSSVQSLLGGSPTPVQANLPSAS